MNPSETPNEQSETTIEDATIISESPKTTETPNPKLETTNQVSDEQKSVLKELGIKDGATAGSDFNPLAGDVKARGEHAEIKTDPTLTNDIEEFTPPPVDAGTPPTPDGPPAPPPAINPEMNTLPPDQQRAAAERMVDMVLQFWGMMKGWAGKKVKIPKDVILKLHADAKLDMNYPFPVAQDESGQIEYRPFIQVIENFNEQSQEGFKVTEKFITNVREPMIRECIRLGIGLTDKQAIIVFWSIEIIQTGITFFSLKGMGEDLLQNQKEFHAQMLGKNGGSGQQQPAGPAQPIQQQEAVAVKTETPNPRPETPLMEPEETKGV